MNGIFFLKGYGYIFSSGLDTMSNELRRHGIEPIVGPHSYSDQMTRKIVAEKPKKIIMVGHSQGANNSILSAIELQKKGITVDLLVTLCPVGSWYFPANVKKAMNFFTGTWGDKVAVQDASKTWLQEFDYTWDWSVWHMNIDKTSHIQSAILSAIYQTLRQPNI